MKHNINKLYRELVAAGIPIYGCSADGTISFTDEATAEQKATAAIIVSQHNSVDVLEIDQATGRVISRAIHPLCGVDESIGILRDQMVQWGNALGLSFTADFTHLNKIAIAAIEKATTIKAAITDA